MAPRLPVTARHGADLRQAGTDGEDTTSHAGTFGHVQTTGRGRYTLLLLP